MSKNRSSGTGLTLDAELQGPAGRVALDVGGGADVEAGGGPGHPLEDEGARGAEQDPGLQVLGHPRPLQRETGMNYSLGTKISWGEAVR